MGNNSLSNKPFDIRDNRLMLSLGELSPKKYCTYSCPFCYLHSEEFSSYSSLPVNDIISWVREVNQPFDIIYVSGDTDSFAPPRTDMGIELLEKLCEFNVDLLFTTRAPFNVSHLSRLAQIQNVQKSKDKMLIGCVSITQLNHPHLEPKPIPTPEYRMEQLRNFKQSGLKSVLAMRPFLPIVPLDDYLQIIESTKDFIDLALGSHWFADPQGKLETGVFQGKSLPSNTLFEYEKMDFDINESMWKVYKNETAEKEVRKRCASLNIPFFMRSKPAIQWLRSTAKLSISDH